MIQNQVNDTLISIFESTTVDNGRGEQVSLFTKKDGKYIDIKYEFEDFQRPTSGVWYALHFLPAQPNVIEIGTDAMNRWSGIFQIDVCVLKSIRTKTPRYGVKDYFDTAYAAIAEVMKRGVYKDRVRITGVGRTSAIDNDDFYSMPITVSWYANLEN